jgi:hypothetical protein
MVLTGTLHGSETEFISEHPELHHYTSWLGLKGIFESGTIWATHYSGLNDSTEGYLLRNVLVEPLSEWLRDNLPRSKVRNRIDYPLSDASGKPSFEVRERARELINLMYDRIIEHPGRLSAETAWSDPLITSFCNHTADSEYERAHGLLSQWRGYAAEGGYCIVFDTESLAAALCKELDTYNFLHATLGGVIYLDDQKTVKQELKEILSFFASPLGVKRHKEPDDFLTSPLAQLTYAAVRIKHRAFKEEREVRLSLTPVTAKMVRDNSPGTFPNLPIKPIQLRQIRGRWVNYIPLFAGQDFTKLVRRVIVGPAESVNKSHWRARQILGSKIEISRSETPFVK